MSRWKCNTALEAQSGACYDDFKSYWFFFWFFLTNCPALEELNDKTSKGIMQTLITFLEDHL